MFNSIGPLELGIVLLIVLLIFGPKRLPGLGKQLGSGMREFKDGITGKGKDDDESKPELNAAEQAFGEPPAPTTTSVASEDTERS
jgi:sec-independent protein translocase protein TatA